MAYVQCKEWSKAGLIKSSKRITASRSKTGIRFAIHTAIHNTKSTCFVEENLCNVFKSDIRSVTAGPQTAVSPKTNAMKLADLFQGNKSTTTIKKVSSSLLTTPAPEFRPEASTVLPKNRMNLSTGSKSGVKPKSKSFVNYNRQPLHFPFPGKHILAMRACFCLGLS